jgi:hypothetical protein
MDNLFNIIKASDIAAKTTNAYMYDIYGKKQWVEVIAFLLENGSDEEQAEWIVRSKHMRWCNDNLDVDDKSQFPQCLGEDAEWEYMQEHFLADFFINVYYPENFNNVKQDALETFEEL